jgi:hypothetical protein
VDRATNHSRTAHGVRAVPARLVPEPRPDDHVVAGFEGTLQAARSVDGDTEGHPIATQPDGDRPGQLGVVVDHEHLIASRGSIGLRELVAAVNAAQAALDVALAREYAWECALHDAHQAARTAPPGAAASSRRVVRGSRRQAALGHPRGQTGHRPAGDRANLAESGDRIWTQICLTAAGPCVQRRAATTGVRHRNPRPRRRHRTPIILRTR